MNADHVPAMQLMQELEDVAVEVEDHDPDEHVMQVFDDDDPCVDDQEPTEHDRQLVAPTSDHVPALQLLQLF